MLLGTLWRDGDNEFERRKPTDVSESFCELNFVILSNKCTRNCVNNVKCTIFTFTLSASIYRTFL